MAAPLLSCGGPDPSLELLGERSRRRAAGRCNIVIVTFFSRQLGANVSRSFFMIFAPLVFASLGLARFISVIATMVAERHWPSPVRAALLGDDPCGHLVHLMNSANVANVIKGLILPEAIPPRVIHFPCRSWGPQPS